MKTVIALFRGINVGGNNIISMKDLKSLLESIGCVEVKTYIQSGNVIFRTASDSHKKLLKDIQLAIRENHGFEPDIMLLDREQFEQAVAENPFNAEKGKDLHFYFLKSIPAKPDLEKLDALKSASEEYALRGPVFYLHAPEGIGRSKLAVKVEQALGVSVTARNLNTVEKIGLMVKD